MLCSHYYREVKQDLEKKARRGVGVKRTGEVNHITHHVMEHVVDHVISHDIIIADKAQH